jgi:SAM-dependent methyltransferase
VNPDDVRREWAGRTGEYSPEYYAYRGPDVASEAVGDALDRFVDREAAVLELGCSAGRHLAHLRDRGYDDLSGVELNGDAFEVMDRCYPDLAAAGTFYHGAFEDVLPEFADGRFEAVYSVESLQHVHRESAWVFADVARVTDNVLVTVENEGPGNDADTDIDGDRDRDDDTDGDDPETGVNYVRGEFPLYYRDWNAVFTGLGLTEVDAAEAGPGGRDTLRTFRSR